MFDKLFGWGKKREHEPDIQLGRYSDNNKSVEKVNRWTDSENLFKEKKYPESQDAFFDYLRDDALNNVVTERRGEELHFRIYQGSKVVRGVFDPEKMRAEVTLARMPKTSVPVMRRLLEQNFNLYYSRYALDGERLCMRFDSEIDTTNPSKLYYGLKELATKSDKQDDLLVQDFTHLQREDSDHYTELPEKEREVKFEQLQSHVKATLDLIATLDRDKLSGGIAYLLLTLGYRLDYLIAPEGSLLYELEKIIVTYYGKDDKSVQEKNQAMIDGYQKLLAKTREEVYPCLFRAKSTFSIVAPQQHKVIAESLYNASQNMAWYRDNKYPEIARQILEYGISFCQYSYSVPRPVTEFFRLFMQVNYPEYFKAMDFPEEYYDRTNNRFKTDEIEEEIEYIINKWRGKYPKLHLNVSNMRYDNLIWFNQSFLTELQQMNFESST